ncbi:hypothetical protein M422DRAFT_215978 [Sphaerobolus stellatus SS14]|uniref:CxC1-like cysteine cluster associated with KDZ transposases domain-containing protein n=1 Tax=Sphaerobolus stellatus (strain SS14) TaxID=990650 RepID=A0A0C9UNR1_SPHS4|nr:hypothetical protein M422DRAFT_215978 [Sphaerobolus stellatus SS14]
MKKRPQPKRPAHSKRISTGTIQVTRKGVTVTKTRLTASGYEERKLQAEQRRSQKIRELNWEDREAVRDMDEDVEEGEGEGFGSHSILFEEAFNSPPPGEEGADFSYEGGEYGLYRDVVSRAREASAKQARYDYRTRKDRTERRNEGWNMQLNQLATAYLEWQKDPNGGSDEVDPEEEHNYWSLVVYDLHESRIRYFKNSGVPPNVTLLRNGCIGTAPHVPTTAFTLRTLNVYQETHRPCPRLSAEAETRALCYLNGIPYLPVLANQFRIAYDAYLSVRYEIQTRINSALGRSTLNWRALNSCPACEYRLENEPELPFSKLVALDGNNSLRCIDPTAISSRTSLVDGRGPRTDYWIDSTTVDVFKDEVKKAKPSPAADTSATEHTMDVDGDTDEITNPGDAAAGADPRSICVERWRNARPEERKKMWAMFVETGIFLAACRHGFVLLICDMIQSGELAKYPLALTSCLIDLFGSDIAIGYDIGCAFSSTVASSPLVGPKAKEANLRFFVPTFHGHAHNRGCQVRWHPLYNTLAGLEDFETCERIFSMSNHLASTTRFASKFHRQQAIEEHFSYWDELKYANLSQFLYNNYRQALETISTLTAHITIVKEKNSITDNDLDRYLEEECHYLESLTNPRECNELEVAYVEALEALEDAEKLVNDVKNNYNSKYNAIIIAKGPQEAARLLANLSRQRTLALNKYDKHLEHITDLENQLEITARWGAQHPKRLAVVEWMTKREYHAALDNLERLVVQRLFELTKLNMSSTGYGLRTHISESLRRRSDAIRTAIVRYNKQAALVTPPRESIEWLTVVQYSFLAEFDLLCFSHNDIQQKPWANPAIREATMDHFKIKCARNELKRLNVEVARLAASICDEAK